MKNSKNLFPNGRENTQRAKDIVRKVARWYRAHGLKADHAIQRAADRLGISNNLSWKLHYDQLWSMATSTLQQIERQYSKARDQERSDLEVQAEKLWQEKLETEPTNRVGILREKAQELRRKADRYDAMADALEENQLSLWGERWTKYAFTHTELQQNISD